MPTKEIRIVKNRKTGELRSVYSDEAGAFHATMSGEVIACRATDIEPVQTPDGLAWGATLRDKDGTLLAVTKNRADAIAQEVDYLNKHIIPNSERFEEVFNG
jgi:hypothetical protein